MIKYLETPEDSLLLPQKQERMYPQPIDEDKPASKMKLKCKTAAIFDEESENLLVCAGWLDD